MAEIEEYWADLVGRDRFTETCHTFQVLLDELAPAVDLPN